MDPHPSPFAAPELPAELTEPGPGQRWSTWPEVTPTQRGPEPRPDWVITSAAAIDTELGTVKTGKEADVDLIERAVPGGAATLLAAKRYRSPEAGGFHRSTAYTEGRKQRHGRDARALAAGTRYGRELRAQQWSGAEFAALCELYTLGAPVPYPVQVSGTEVLMEFLGDDDGAAPRLVSLRPRPSELRDLWEQLVAALDILTTAGLAHGDLSPYNLLVHHGRLVLIDLPQVVDIAANTQGLAMLHRDCVNVCDWFRRRGFDVDADELFADLVARAW